MNTTLLPLALAILASPRGGDPPPQTLPRDPGPRTEHFVLEIPSPSPLADWAPATCVGAVVLRRRAVEGGYQLEGEWHFERSDEDGGDEQVLHIEQIAASGSKLIWREWGSSRARSLSITREAGGRKLASVDIARGGTRRDSLMADDPVCFPLELLERIRLGDAPSATCMRFDPLTRDIERVEVKAIAKDAAEGSAPATRSYEIVRGDGTTAGICEFLGSELHSFRSQRGGPVARRVDEAEYLARSPRTSVTIRRP